MKKCKYLFGFGGDFGILWLFFDDLFDDRLLNGDGINLLLDLNGDLLNDINALEFLPINYFLKKFSSLSSLICLFPCQSSPSWCKQVTLSKNFPVLHLAVLAKIHFKKFKNVRARKVRKWGGRLVWRKYGEKVVILRIFTWSKKSRGCHWQDCHRICCNQCRVLRWSSPYCSLYCFFFLFISSVCFFYSFLFSSCFYWIYYSFVIIFFMRNLIFQRNNLKTFGAIYTISHSISHSLLKHSLHFSLFLTISKISESIIPFVKTSEQTKTSFLLFFSFTHN